jgi:hypothetical protein
MCTLSTSLPCSRKYPYNIIALFAFTLVMSVFVGVITSFYSVQVQGVCGCVGGWVGGWVGGQSRAGL